MAEKKKAYRRFQDLTRQATAPMAAEAEMGSPPAETLPIRLSPDVRRALEQQAAADNTTPSEIVQEALRRYLEVPR
jgi:hypothetical protein